MNEPNKRSAVYNANRTRRMVSAPGGMWQAQERGSDKGTREHDPWFDVGAPAAWQRASATAGVQ